MEVMNSLLVWSLLVVSMYLPVAEAFPVCAVVELAQLSASLGQEKVDLVEPLMIFHFLCKENLSEMLIFFNKDQHQLIRKMLGHLCTIFNKT